MSAKDFTSFRLDKYERPKRIEPELIAKNLPQNNFAVMKRRAKKCLRCGEYMIIPENTTQSLCPTCRGGEMSINDYLRFKETWNSGYVVTGILEDMRK